MPLFERSNRTIINNLRVHGSALDPLAARLRLGTYLEAAQSHPKGLGRSAILCIRSLHDPAPGLLSLKAGRAGQSGHARRWEEAWAASLEALAHDAVRPILGPVPAGAQAILFADEAEMLACLAIDCCKGDTGAHWWWRGLFGTTPANAMLHAWLDSPAAIPGALAHLSRRRFVHSFAASLPTGGTRALIERLLSHFRLRDLSNVLLPLLNPPAPSPTPDLPSTTRLNSATPSHSADQQTAPWLPHAAESSSPNLDLPAQLLLGVGLVLHRAPAIVRSRQFEHKLKLWANHITAGTPPAKGSETSGNVLAPPDLSHSQAPQQPTGVPSAQTPPTDSSTKYAQPGTHSSVTSPDAAGAATLQTIETSSGPMLSEDNATSPVTNVEARMEQGSSAVPSQPLWTVGEADYQETEPAPSLASFDTGLGGIFYLLNLALYLDLYGDFAAPQHPDLGLSPWDLLVLLGKRYLGKEHADDPIWDLLASLAGRDPDLPPGSYFDAPEQWRVPLEWLVPFAPAEAWSYSARGGRLRAKHPAGFLVLDVPRTGDPPAMQLRAELAPYREVATGTMRQQALHMPNRSRTPLKRWLTWLEAYTRARLMLALGVSGSDDLVPLVFKHRAHIETSATHLHVTMDLAELPIELRFAGLDRDIGWMPAAGKSIYFHFD